MYQNRIDVQQIQQLVKPLVESGIYKNETCALNDIIVEFVKSKLSGYKTITKKFEIKYKSDFNEFSANLKNAAISIEEDDWMDWKAALEMEQAWQETLKNVIRNANKY